MLRIKGWKINHKRIDRLWRKEALKVPALIILRARRNAVSQKSPLLSALSPDQRADVRISEITLLELTQTTMNAL